ncbi:MAG: hypothetical protein J6K74_07895 [Marinifilaceae bacterium]|nr:hypothetical protein [Marinifilaceae bacterium]
MEFIQKPDQLTFAATMPDFIVSGIGLSAQVTLYKDTDKVLLKETMFPSDKGLVIDVKKIINDSLRVKIPTSSIFHQDEALGLFKLVVISKGETIEYSFNALRGGYEDYNIPSRYNAMELIYSFQPSIKQITTESPEWLTFFIPLSTLRIRFRYYLSHGALCATTYIDSPYSSTKNNAGLFNIDCSYSAAYKLSLTAGGIYFAYYDVDLVSEGNGSITPVTPTQRFLITQATNAHKYYLFENTLGGIDTLICTGDLTRRLSMSSDITISDDIKDDSSNTHSLSFEQSVGIFTSEIELMWFRDFILSSQRYEVKEEHLYQIIIEEADSEINLADADVVNFSFRRASEDKYFGFARKRMELPTGLIFDGPGDVNFF